MNQNRDLVSRIREYEANVSVARKTNERSLPIIQALLSDLDRFNFGKEDLDLKQTLVECHKKFQQLTPDNISPEVLDELREKIFGVRTELADRYSERLDRYASRQSNI